MQNILKEFEKLSKEHKNGNWKDSLDLLKRNINKQRDDLEYF